MKFTPDGKLVKADEKAPEAPAAESNAILPKKGPAMGDTPSKISSDANT